MPLRFTAPHRTLAARDNRRKAEALRRAIGFLALQRHMGQPPKMREAAEQADYRLARDIQNIRGGR